MELTAYNTLNSDSGYSNEVSGVAAEFVTLNLF
jgi:hypothetical protein